MNFQQFHHNQWICNNWLLLNCFEKKMATENSEMEVDGIENDSKYI